MIDLSTSSCRFEIRVNDVPVINLNLKNQTSTMFPINYAILQNGRQEISIKVLPILGQANLNKDAALKYDIKLFDTGNDFKFQKQFGNYKTPAVDQNPKLPSIVHNDFFTAEVPYKITAWQSSKKLENNDTTKSALIKAYEEVIKMLIDKRYNDFKEKISKREYIIATTMYLSKTESEARINNIIRDLQKGFQIQPLPKESIMLLYAYGKTAALKKFNGESALYAYNKQTGEELMIDITFHLASRDQKFEII